MSWDSAKVAKCIEYALEEDIGAGDATCLAMIPAAATAWARIIARTQTFCPPAR